MEYPRLVGNVSYTMRYHCASCEKENILDVSVYIPQSQRPRSLDTCMYCGSSEISHIKEETSSAAPAVIMNAMRLDGISRHRTSSDFRDRLRQIHESNHGSRIAETSNLTKL